MSKRLNNEMLFPILKDNIYLNVVLNLFTCTRLALDSFTLTRAVFLVVPLLLSLLLSSFWVVMSPNLTLSWLVFLVDSKGMTIFPNVNTSRQIRSTFNRHFLIKFDEINGKINFAVNAT